MDTYELLGGAILLAPLILCLLGFLYAFIKSIFSKEPRIPDPAVQSKR